MPFFHGYENNRSPLSVPELRFRRRMDWILSFAVIIPLIAFGIWLRGWDWAGQAFIAFWINTWRDLTFWFHPEQSLIAMGVPRSLFAYFPHPDVTPAPRVVPVPSAGTPPTAHHFGAILFGMMAALGSLSPLVLISLALSRLASRWHRARAMEWVEIQFFQHDESTPQAVTAALDAIYSATRVRSRWLNTARFYRWALGEPGWTLQIIRDPIHPTMPQGLHLVIGTPGPQAMRTVQNALRATYTNLRFDPWHIPMARTLPYVARWSLRYRNPVHLVKLLPDYDVIPMETLLQALAKDTFPDGEAPAFMFQWVLTPMAAETARKRLEKRINYVQWENFAAEKAGSAVAVDQVGHGRFHTEWRIAAESWEVLQKAAGAWSADNRHAELRMRLVIIWRWWFTRWMEFGLPGIWPLSRSIPLWSGELATFLALPTGRLRIVDLHRSMTRRMPASQKLIRQPRAAIVEGEPHDPVGIREADRHKNILVRGTQGTGKSQVLLQLFRADALAGRAQPETPDSWQLDPTQRPAIDPAKAVVLLDIGKDTCDAALRLVPPERKVILVDPTDGHNAWLLQSFQDGMNPGTQTGHLIELLVNVFADDAIQDRSKHYLRMFIATALEVVPDASFATVYAMFSDATYRDRIQRQCHDPLLRMFWDHELPAQMQGGPRFIQDAFGAPRNKLGAILTHPMVRTILAGHVPGDPFPPAEGVVLDWDRVIRERQVVIIKIPKDELPSEAVRLLGTTVVLSLWHAIQRQAKLPEAERIPVSLIIDEAQNFISHSFATMLAEGRALGLQLSLAVRFLGEIQDPRAEEAIDELCHNLICFRVHKVDEAKNLMHLMQRLYANNITFSEDVQALTNFAADDFLHLPDYRSICFWQSRGTLEPPFVATSIPWKPLDADAAWVEEHERWAQTHRDDQPQRAGNVEASTTPWDGTLPNPFATEPDPSASPEEAAVQAEDPTIPMTEDAASEPDTETYTEWVDTLYHPTDSDPAEESDPSTTAPTFTTWPQWLAECAQPAHFAAPITAWLARHPWVSAPELAAVLAEAPPSIWASPLQWQVWANQRWPAMAPSTPEPDLTPTVS